MSEPVKLARVIVGSRLHGLTLPASDTDVRRVWVTDVTEMLSTWPPDAPELAPKDDGWEPRHVVGLLLKGSPRTALSIGSSRPIGVHQRAGASGHKEGRWSMSLPGAIEKTIVAMHGEDGQRWLDDLPRRIADYERRWDLRVGQPFANLSYNYVASASGLDGVPAVLKLCYGGREVETEMAALRLAGGEGMVRLLREDLAGHAMLLQRAVPGDMLIDHPDDEEATRIAAGVMAALWRPAPTGNPFPTVADWGQGFERMRQRYDGGTGPLPSELTGRAERLFAGLVATSAGPVVLHGDLHHYNLLRDRDHWLAIDPKGVVGEPAYEIGALMRNRLPPMGDDAVATDVLTRRLRIVADVTGLDADRMRQWTIAQALLSVWWSIEDHGESVIDEPWFAEELRVAELLERVTL